MATPSRVFSRRPRFRFALILLFSGGPTSTPLAATVIQVTTTADDATANGNCTLREAISAAANDIPYDLCQAGTDEVDVVEVPGGSYAWTNGFLNVPFDPIRIHGAEATPPTTIVDLGVSTRFLRIYGTSEVTLENFQLLNGSAMLDGTNPNGGQISSDNADLVLRNVHTVGGIGKGGGAVYFRGFTGDALRIERCRFDSSNALSPDSGLVMGGALQILLMGGASARVLDSEFLHAAATGTNKFAWPMGGAIFVDMSGNDALEIARSRFHDNRVIAFAGGLASGGAIALVVRASTEILLRDLRFTANFVAEPSLGFRASTIDIDAQLASSVTLDRLTAFGNGEDDPGSHIRLATYDTTEIVATNVVLSRGPDTGIEAVTWNTSSIRLGHVTAGAHDQYGIHLEAHDSGTFRIENSLAFGSPNDIIDTVPSSIDPSTLPQGTDPAFEDPDADDYRLAIDSPAINFGDDALDTVRPYDAAHGLRSVGVSTDAGALEFGAVFSDGFETGDASAWTSSTPLVPLAP